MKTLYLELNNHTPRYTCVLELSDDGKFVEYITTENHIELPYSDIEQLQSAVIYDDEDNVVCTVNCNKDAYIEHHSEFKFTFKLQDVLPVSHFITCDTDAIITIDGHRPILCGDVSVSDDIDTVTFKYPILGYITP